jgi:hypothetical protein
MHHAHASEALSFPGVCIHTTGDSVKSTAPGSMSRLVYNPRPFTVVDDIRSKLPLHAIASAAWLLRLKLSPLAAIPYAVRSQYHFCWTLTFAFASSLVHSDVQGAGPGREVEKGPHRQPLPNPEVSESLPCCVIAPRRLFLFDNCAACGLQLPILLSRGRPD